MRADLRWEAMAPDTLPKSSALEICGHRLQPDAPGFADALAAAFGSHRRPRCLCRPEGVEMYVARLGDGYIAKRMPDTGSSHMPNCPSFGPPAELFGLRDAANSILEDPVSGITTLKLGFSLSKRPQRSREPLPGTTAVDAEPATKSGRLSLRSLLHYLWDEAELTRWHPGFAGRRNWATVRRHLLQAADQKLVGAIPLANRLYVPEPWTADQRDAINDRRASTWASASLSPSSRQQLLLLIGEVKAIAPARQGHRALVKQVPDLGFAMDDRTYGGLARHFHRELALWSASDVIRMVMIATFGLGQAGAPRLEALCLMAVTREWLPVETLQEQQLVERLVHGQRSFSKLLRYDRRRDERMASVLLTEPLKPAELRFA